MQGRLVAGKGGGQPFIDRARTLVADGPLKDVVKALLTALQAISRQVGSLTRPRPEVVLQQIP
jgi:transposase